MTIEELAITEQELAARVEQAYRKGSKDLESIFSASKKVHQHYTSLAVNDDEALKRGLFIQWFQQTDPPFLTGINELDPEAMQKIIELIEAKIQANALDAELNWMLHYYSNWDWTFGDITNQKGLAKLLTDKTDKFFPEKIDTIEMKKRGRMGIYFTSLTRFSKQS